ncbi:family 16 glycosylhydrolase [Leptospira interrogans]
MSGAPIPDVSRLRGLLPGRELRHAPRLQWLGNPLAYAIGAPIVQVASVGTMLIAPRLLDPIAFGTFALLSSLFLYTSKADLGLSQLADREIAAQGRTGHELAVEMLRAWWIIAAVLLAITLPLVAVISFLSAWPFADTMLAIVGGAAFMVANGPVVLYRAGSHIWEFTTAALVLHAGLTLPRLAGLLIAGVTGCFAVLAFWYGSLALLLSRDGLTRPSTSTPLIPLLRRALPLFAFNGLWLLYMSSNRWISAALSSPHDLGLFAFGANLSLAALGLLATISQVRYPKLVAHIAQTEPGGASNLIEREAMRLGLALTVGVLIAIPLLPAGIRLAFPGYEGSVSATTGLAVSCIPLGVAAWVIPMIIPLSERPGADALWLFVPAFAALIVAMIVGNRIAGIAGQAWACAVAGLLLIAGIALLLRHLHILSLKAMLRLVLLQAVFVAGVFSVARAADPAPGVPEVAYDAAAPIVAFPPAGYPLAFEDTFDNLRLWDGSDHGIWEPHYPWGDRSKEEELQYYVDPRPGRDHPAISGLAPLTIDNGILTIRARPIPAADRPLAENYAYASGMLTSVRRFSLTYGYVEMRARLPRGKGFWPAFWLIPVDRSWPPEIDVMEMLGDDTHAFYTNVHGGADGRHIEAQTRITTPDLAADFHVYAAEWNAREVIFYFDGRRIAAAPTPSDMHKPMYLVVNLAMGGWAGAPDDSTSFPGEFAIDWIRAYRPQTMDEPK